MSERSLNRRTFLRAATGASVAAAVAPAAPIKALRAAFVVKIGGRDTIVIALVRGRNLELKFPMDGGEGKCTMEEVEL